MAKVLFLHILCFLILSNEIGASQVALALFNDLSAKLETFTSVFKTNINSIHLRLDVIEGAIGLREENVNSKIDMVKDNIGVGQSEHSDSIKTKDRFMKALISEKRYMRSLVRDNEEKFDKFKLGVKNIVSNLNLTFHELSDTLVARTEQSKLVDDILNIQDRVSTLENNHKTCEVPTDIDRRLLMYMYKSQEREDIGSGDVVDADSYVYINCTGVDERRYEPAHRRFQCKSGQWKEADRNPNWNFGNNGQFPTCREVVMCPQLYDIHHGEIFQDSSDGIRDNYESVAEYTCTRGYRVFGTEMKYRRTCQLNGKWSGPEPYCEVPTCDEITPLSGGEIYYSDDKRIEHSFAFYACDDDYTMYPTSTVKSQCTEMSGEYGWLPRPPACHIVCDEKCILNGGTCLKPGICGNCPASRYGDNCELENCTLLESSIYNYTDSNGIDIILPQKVTEGTNITVACKYPAEYDYYSYYYYSAETITCKNGSFPDVSIYCKDSSETAAVEKQTNPCEQFMVKNGRVTHNELGEYHVICDVGYSLNLPEQGRDRPCTCSEKELICFAGNKPKCEADTCDIPLDMDNRLTIYQLPNHVYLSAGDKIDHESHVFFNCSNINIIAHKYEPVNRRFQCKFGRWREADRNLDWNFGNNGTFPTCRRAICNPPCENGGVCFRDGQCQCQHMTEGNRCQIPVCDEKCTMNGGSCLKPGKCGNCPASRHGDNCELKYTCDIPLDMDNRLTIYQLPNHVYLNAGDKIDHERHVFFNCSNINIIAHKYEPVNRRFQCKFGRWREADRNLDWNFGNNGTFPTCRKAICNPPCENGGVCFRDGQCQCQHMTEGNRCQIPVCDEKCTMNGGTCLKPGKCGNCPASRHGDNCELKNTCLLPQNAARHETNREIYSAGETILKEHMRCDRGQVLSSAEVMTCQHNRTWTNIIKCQNTHFKYFVRIQVADDRYAPTRDTVYVRIDGYDENTEWFTMKGDFGRNNLVENEFRGIDVRPIRNVVVKKSKGSWDDNAKIVFASIYIGDGDDYYVFTEQDRAFWLKANIPTPLYISGHPERCVHTFGEAMNRYPISRGGHVLVGSLRECKQRCVTTRSMKCNSIFFMPVRNHIHGFGHCYHYSYSPDDNRFKDNTRSDTRSGYVSYKRSCRRQP